MPAHAAMTGEPCWLSRRRATMHDAAADWRHALTLMSEAFSLGDNGRGEELLNRRMVGRGSSHRFEVLPGEHAAEYWIGNADRYLAFYSSALAAAAQLIPIDSDAS